MSAESQVGRYASAMLAGLYDFLRRSTGPRTRAWFKRQPWFVPVTRVLFGSDVYSESYFEGMEKSEGPSVEAIAQWVTENLRPSTAVDIGCGPGHLMAALHRRGVRMLGVDLAEAALRRTRSKGLRAERLDLTKERDIPGAPFDLVICFEVAEHLDAKFAPGLVETLTRSGRQVMLTAAEADPSVGPGLHHVNEQPNEYWIDLMRQRGWKLDAALTGAARRTFEQKGVIIYLQKVMIFAPDGAAGATGAARGGGAASNGHSSGSEQR